MSSFCLASFPLCASFTDLGVGAFESCSNLCSALLGSGLKVIGQRAFLDCINLTNIIIPEGVTTIGSSAFSFCHRMASIKLPDTVTDIGFGTFEGCTSLTSITVPKGVTNFWGWVFGLCTNLETIYFMGNAPTVDADTFGRSTNATVFYLPGTAGWGPTLDGIPTALWLPQITGPNSRFGVESNLFGFIMAWAQGREVVVEAATNFSNPVWISIATNLLGSDRTFFADPESTNFPIRFYRLRWP
ncbi:MAG TPA: leucine-rich repeat domain-containing protein [Candidatus Limnocylindrales bacterium]|nr:leucine-rich repeat domain-containing protein [Candidatus Limnocylindrales bacterium]